MSLDLAVTWPGDWCTVSWANWRLLVHRALKALARHRAGHPSASGPVCPFDETAIARCTFPDSFTISVILYHSLSHSLSLSSSVSSASSVVLFNRESLSSAMTIILGPFSISLPWKFSSGRSHSSDEANWQWTVWRTLEPCKVLQLV